MGGCASKPKEFNGESEAPIGLEEPLVVSDPTVGAKKAVATDGTFQKSPGALFTENEENKALCENEGKDPAATPELKLDVEAETPKSQEHHPEDPEPALEHKAEPPNVEEHLDLEAKAETPKAQENIAEALELKPEPPTETLEPKSETPEVQENSSDETNANLVVAEEKSEESGAKAEVQPGEEVAVAATEKKEGVASFFKQIMAKNFLVKSN